MIAKALPSGGPIEKGQTAQRDGSSHKSAGFRRSQGQASALVVDLLEALGLDTTAEDLRGTPDRVVELWSQLLTPAPFSPEVSSNGIKYDEPILICGIGFSALCAQHLVPLRGVAHVGYLPNEWTIDMSQLTGLVEACSRGLQLQEKLASQIAEWLHRNLSPYGVGVVVEMEHLCMSVLGVQANGVPTVTSSFRGLLNENRHAREEFLISVQINA